MLLRILSSTMPPGKRIHAYGKAMDTALISPLLDPVSCSPIIQVMKEYTWYSTTVVLPWQVFRLETPIPAYAQKWRNCTHPSPTTTHLMACILSSERNYYRIRLSLILSKSAIRDSGAIQTPPKHGHCAEKPVKEVGV